MIFYYFAYVRVSLTVNSAKRIFGHKTSLHLIEPTIKASHVGNFVERVKYLLKITLPVSGHSTGSYLNNLNITEIKTDTITYYDHINSPDVLEHATNVLRDSKCKVNTFTIKL